MKKPSPAPIRTTLMNIQYSSGAANLCLAFGEKKTKKYKSFQIMPADKSKEGDYTALIRLKQNTIVITQKSDKQKYELASPLLAAALKALKDNTDMFQTTKAGLLHMRQTTEGDAQTARPKKAVPARFAEPVI